MESSTLTEGKATMDYIIYSIKFLSFSSIDLHVIAAILHVFARQLEK